MTDRPVVEPAPWPPLIVASTTPTWVKARDVVLTLVMWVLFAIMLRTEFDLFFGRYLARLGLGDDRLELMLVRVAQPGVEARR